MSIDFIYGVVSLILGTFMLVSILYLRSKLKKNPVVFLSSFYIKKYKQYAFVFFFVTTLTLAVNYAVATVISFGNPSTNVWEYGNIILFSTLAIFFFFMSIS
ncbi:MAG: hypothetical protein BJBARM5_0613 [Candidatus Parvarchaeum acidophilus ARMAN-5]|jgi:hypothetical protein|uniref:Uncharacterized protein n=1 Tax=Candidatus Parvarchaeum acidophilus ARMAN-5 TaxID=662762 RepID=D6GVU4_PARA5|nr:MAG: hypothetical protein BJBARM5_0613 [Candidatus Parvarchaeum acidophilus ARMAN-5]